MQTRRIAWLSMCLAACSTDGGSPDGGAVDAAVLLDGSSDAGHDTGAADAGAADAGAADAGAADAGTPDAGSACDADGDGHASVACGGDDCDDHDADRFPTHPERCDAAGHDEDCDPTTFGDIDRDLDGHVDAACCNVGASGARACGDDCDDFDITVRPGATERCNETDDDCDGMLDEGVAHTYHRDADHDGFGCTCSDTMTACAAPAGYIEDASDCDDTRAAFHPGANGTCGLCVDPLQRIETCDGLDDDCSGIVDDGAASASCAIAHGTATCSAGACLFSSCDPGYHTCGATCASNAATESCGASCSPCPTRAHATTTCDGVSCGLRCVTGSVLTGATCDPIAPRPMSPMSTASVTSRRPTFRWSLAAGTDGARVEICRDRACTTILATIDATGSSGAPSADLLAGVLFWRLHGSIGGDAGAATSVTWELTVPTISAPVSTSFGTTLDVNGDGFADIASGEWGVPSSAGDDVGEVFVFHGSSGGIGGTAADLDGLDGPNGAFGISVASAGDIDGDGFGDLIVGADGVANSQGRAYVFLGGPSGVRSTPVNTLIGTDGIHTEFGYSVAGAGDVDGDGYGDVVIGAYEASGRGKVYVYAGGRSGLRATPMAVLTSPAGLNGTFGYSVAGAGDVDGDGLADIVIGARQIDTVYVYRGIAGGIASTPLTLVGPVPGGLFGTAVGCAGDVDGDGYADVVIGASSLDGGAGRVFVYHGSAAGLSTTPTTWLAPVPGGGFGFAVSAAGDVDGDGLGDVVVGAPNVMSGAGAAYLYAGASVAPRTSLAGTAPNGRFGFAVAGLGDVNGDGHGDVVIGSAFEATGRARIHLGDGSGLMPTAATTLRGVSANGGYGEALAL